MEFIKRLWMYYEQVLNMYGVAYTYTINALPFHFVTRTWGKNKL